MKIKNEELIIGIVLALIALLFGSNLVKFGENLCESIFNEDTVKVFTTPYHQEMQEKELRSGADVYTYEFTCNDRNGNTRVKRVVAGTASTAQLVFNNWVWSEVGDYTNLGINTVYDSADAAEYGDRYKSLDGAADYLADG